MDRLLPEAAPQVRRHLNILDGIEQQMIEGGADGSEPGGRKPGEQSGSRRGCVVRLRQPRDGQPVRRGGRPSTSARGGSGICAPSWDDQPSTGAALATNGRAGFLPSAKPPAAASAIHGSGFQPRFGLEPLLRCFLVWMCCRARSERGEERREGGQARRDPLPRHRVISLLRRDAPRRSAAACSTSSARCVWPRSTAPSGVRRALASLAHRAPARVPIT